MFNFIKKNYQIINITILCINIYFLLFPFFSKILKLISPNLVKCAYLEITQKPCPLCGGTRFLENIHLAFIDVSYLLNFFTFIIAFIIFEIIFRMSNICRKNQSTKILIFDFIIHFTFVICLLSYYLFFLF